MDNVRVKEFKKTIHKRFIAASGHTLATYHYPKIDRLFTSPMVNDYNMNLCGVWWVPGVEHLECLTRVFLGTKPMGFYVTCDKDDYEKVLAQVTVWNMPYVAEFKDGRGEIGVCANGTFGELFDLSALAMDYENYEQIALEYRPYCFNWINELRDKQLSEYLTMDYANPESVKDIILVGLLLGYPIETTLSILWW